MSKFISSTRISICWIMICDSLKKLCIGQIGYLFDLIHITAIANTCFTDLDRVFSSDTSSCGISITFFATWSDVLSKEMRISSVWIETMEMMKTVGNITWLSNIDIFTDILYDRQSRKCTIETLSPKSVTVSYPICTRFIIII